MGNSASLLEQLRQRGNQAFSAGDFGEAHRQYSLAIDVDPSDHKLYSNRSAANVGLGKFAEALADAMKAIELNQTWAKGYFRAGIALLNSGELLLAESMLKKASALDLTAHISELDKLKKEINPHARGKGNVFTWGQNSNGTCGSGDTRDRVIAKPVDHLRGVYVDDVSCGLMHTLCVTGDGTVMAFGQNNHAQCGLPSTIPQALQPEYVSALFGKTITNVACGGGHSCAITSDGLLYTWGVGAKGQCGHNDFANCEHPRQVTGMTKVTGISCGIGHTVAVVEGKSLYSFGWNNTYQCGLGLDSNKDVGLPSLVHFADEDEHIQYVSCGGGHTAVVFRGGNLYTFGSGSCGQLGHGSEKDAKKPTLIKDLRDVALVVCGEEFTIAINKTRQVFTFGLNCAGQLGDGGSTNRLAPFHLTALDNAGIEDVVATQASVLALTSSGDTLAWGSLDGLVGDSDRFQAADRSPRPIEFLQRKNVVRIARGRQHFVVVTLGAYPPLCTMSGPLLNSQQANVGARVRLKILAYDLNGHRIDNGGDKFVCILSCRLGHREPTTQIIRPDDNMDGSYTLDIVPIYSGSAKLAVMLCDMHIAGSPFLVTFSPGSIDPKNSDFRLVQQSKPYVAGNQVPFIAKLCDVHANPITQELSSIQGWAISPTGEKKTLTKGDREHDFDSVVGFAFTPTVSGQYEVCCAIDGNVFKSIKVDIAHGEPCPRYCTAKGPGLTSARVGELAQFEISVVDEYHNPCIDIGTPIIQFQDGGGILNLSVVPVEATPGTFLVTYETTKAGSATVVVPYIQNGNFVIDSKGGRAAPAQCVAASLGGVVTINSQKPNTAKILLRDLYGNNATECHLEEVLVTLEDNKKQKTPCKLQKLEPQQCEHERTFEFHPKNAGEHSLRITVNGQDIAASPFKISCRLDAAEQKKRAEEEAKLKQQELIKKGEEALKQGIENITGIQWETAKKYLALARTYFQTANFADGISRVEQAEANLSLMQRQQQSKKDLLMAIKECRAATEKRLWKKARSHLDIANNLLKLTIDQAAQVEEVRQLRTAIEAGESEDLQKEQQNEEEKRRRIMMTIKRQEEANRKAAALEKERLEAIAKKEEERAQKQAQAAPLSRRRTGGGFTVSYIGEGQVATVAWSENK